jgi:hypothetical protein
MNAMSSSTEKFILFLSNEDEDFEYSRYGTCELSRGQGDGNVYLLPLTDKNKEEFAPLTSVHEFSNEIQCTETKYTVLFVPKPTSSESRDEQKFFNALCRLAKKRDPSSYMVENKTMKALFYNTKLGVNLNSLKPANSKDEKGKKRFHTLYTSPVVWEEPEGYEKLVSRYDQLNDMEDSERTKEEEKEYQYLMDKLDIFQDKIPSEKEYNKRKHWV